MPNAVSPRSEAGAILAGGAFGSPSGRLSRLGAAFAGATSSAGARTFAVQEETSAHGPREERISAAISIGRPSPRPSPLRGEREVANSRSPLVGVGALLRLAAHLELVEAADHV